VTVHLGLLLGRRRGGEEARVEAKRLLLGVIQCAKYVRRSVASVSPSARSMVKNAGFADWQA
jgi:hypothetical protein